MNKYGAQYRPDEFEDKNLVKFKGNLTKKPILRSGIMDDSVPSFNLESFEKGHKEEPKVDDVIKGIMASKKEGKKIFF